MDFLFIIAGLVLLLAAGDALVRGAVAVSLRLGVPAVIVGATIVAFGTSAPELLISVQAALEGSPGIALGNVVGSNIANVWLVLGLPALISPIAGCGKDAHRNLWFMMLSTAIFTALILPGTIWWWGGLILIGVTALMVADSVRHSMTLRAANGEAAEELAELEDVDPHMAPWKIGGLIVASLIGLPVGAQLLIDGARGVAMAFGVSETVIGLTIVAVGTSLPELATTLMAAVRAQADVAIGNVVGSNIFNVTFIIGAAALVGPMEVPGEILMRDNWVMIAAALTLAPFVLMCRRICRWTGMVYLLLYVGFATAVVLG
ncbi:calcium/sodium antiporter [Limibaculum sp. FT325]|uniref:calcium/sodium antiporter n=1 Tax=Thermohalobaculum sediminis TaxID=2939436 RepID=UPI0020C068AD|nr:calcium/sodium antiporter [Limibaculum sediminis]MCL5777095.1 calcium/sodium antiporter [Limibaculum sediminis]